MSVAQTRIRFTSEDLPTNISETDVLEKGIFELSQMGESIHISGETRRERYESLLPQLSALTEGETDTIANLANIMSALKYGMNFFWVGIYFAYDDRDELVLGPFQGPVACTRIRRGKGVCGTCWEKAQTLIVPDVEKFPGHIACSSLSRSEIVVPVIDNKHVVGVLDIDSEEYDQFDDLDKNYLEQIIDLLIHGDSVWLP